MQKGFSLVELMIVVAIVGVLLAIAIPSYESYRIKVNRGDMKTEMMRISQDLQRYQMVNKTFKDASLSTVGYSTLPTVYPKSDTALYTLELTLTNNNREWQLKATPITTAKQKGNGVLCLNSKGEKSWTKGVTTCALSSSSTWDDR